jgi:MFS family permease
MGVPAGLLLATLVFTAVSSALPEEQLLRWGWRVPFLLSAALVGVGLFIRLQIVETPAFTQSAQAGEPERFPLGTVLRTQLRHVLIGMGLRFAENGSFYILTTFVLSYGTDVLRVPRSTMLLSVSLAAFLGLFATPAFAALSDRVGRRPVYGFGALFLLAFAYPFFWLLDSGEPRWIALAIALGVNLGHDAMYGPQAAFLSELYDTRVRYSGASFAYQATSALAGGLAPIIATALMASHGSGSVAAYMAGMAAITLVAVILAPETHRVGLTSGR